VRHRQVERELPPIRLPVLRLQGVFVAGRGVVVVVAGQARGVGQGVGRGIVEQLLVEAQALELPRVFALTRKPGFFLKLGFYLTRIEHLPRKVQKDCVFCPKFHACDEAAVWIPLLSTAPEPFFPQEERLTHQAPIPLLMTPMGC
jgi:hypothetical protein